MIDLQHPQHNTINKWLIEISDSASRVMIPDSCWSISELHVITKGRNAIDSLKELHWLFGDGHEVIDVAKVIELIEAIKYFLLIIKPDDFQKSIHSNALRIVENRGDKFKAIQEFLTPPVAKALKLFLLVKVNIGFADSLSPYHEEDALYLNKIFRKVANSLDEAIFQGAYFDKECFVKLMAGLLSHAENINANDKVSEQLVKMKDELLDFEVMVLTDTNKKE